MKTNMQVVGKLKDVSAVAAEVDLDDFDNFYAAAKVRMSPEGKEELARFEEYYILASQAIRLRRRHKWTQAEAAIAAGVHQSDISRLERGTANLSSEKLGRIAHAYGKVVAFVDEPRVAHA